MRFLAPCALVLAACSAPIPAGPDASTPIARYPAVPFNSGPVLKTAQLQLVSYAGDARAADIDAFLETLVQSGWLPTTTGEYGVTTVTHAKAVTLAATAAAAVVLTDVRTSVSGWVKDGTLSTAAQGEAPYLYVVLLPDGTSLTSMTGNACASNPGTGLHDETDDPGAGFPFIALPSCPPRFSAFLSRTDAMELDLARLLVDTLTDPSPRAEPGYALTDISSPWYALGSEVGDFCWGRLVVESGFHLQRVWSNAAAAAGGEPCLPTSGAAFGVGVTPDVLQTMTVNAPITFAVKGWSTGTVDDWTLSAAPWVGDFPISASLDKTTLNDGLSAQLTITIPYAQPAGTYGAVLIRAAEQDDTALWPVTFTVH